jgi:hypothetical protein
MTTLTEEQLREFDRSGQSPQQVVDPRDSRKYVLIPIDEYEAMKDARDQTALRQASLSNLSRHLGSMND